VQDALSSPQQVLWREAIKRELDSLGTKGTWELCTLPPGRKVVTSKWVFDLKYDGSGNITKYKARLVARGFLQKKGVDYNETYAPVVHMTSMRAIFAIAAHEGLQVDQLDVETAYLNGLMDTEVYMTQPPGFANADNISAVCRLFRTIYGLKQSGRIWNELAHAAMLSLGFNRISADFCVYIRYTEEGRCILGLHVDDCIVAGTPAANLRFRKEFADKFTIKDLGLAKFVVGLQLKQSDRVISVSQATYMNNVVDEIETRDNCTTAAPLTDSAVKKIIDAVMQREKYPLVDSTAYRQIIGKLMYAMVGTRPDIAYALGFLAKFSQDPNEL
jgi:hypothetical protein